MVDGFYGMSTHVGPFYAEYLKKASIYKNNQALLFKNPLLIMKIEHGMCELVWQYTSSLAFTMSLLSNCTVHGSFDMSCETYLS